MTGNVRQTPPEPTWGTLWVTSDNSPTRDGTGPQKAPEGTEDMKSIDNLREYVLAAPSICSTTRAILVGYIDNIDKEVEELRERDYRNGREDAEGAAEFADRLCRASERREDVTLWGVDYTALPVDADGVPIHVGDVIKTDYSEPEEVESMHYYGSGEWTVTTTHNATMIPNGTYHHHAPTVEDVLREFADKWLDTDRETKHERAVIAEYAAKLRLAGEDA